MFKEDHMNTRTHGMKVMFLLAMVAILWAAIPATTTMAGYASGTRAVGCDDFLIVPKPTFVNGKAMSADVTEYNFTVNMKLGFDINKEDEYCKARPCTAKVFGSWNEKTREANERFDITCTYGKEYSPYPATLTLYTRVSCPKDPWTNSVGITGNPVSCSAPTVTGPAPFGKIMTAYPLTAVYMGSAGREMLNRSVPGWGTGSFVLPPALPPEVRVDSLGDSDSVGFMPGENARISIIRPLDGSAAWYKKAWRYDVEFEVKRPGGKMAIEGWVKKTLVSSVPGADKADFTVPYGKFFDDPVANWNIETLPSGKKYRVVRVHARVHADGPIHPWSAWRRFFVEIPKTAFMIKPTGGTGKTLP